jgi:hypothetical protein
VQLSSQQVVQQIQLVAPGYLGKGAAFALFDSIASKCVRFRKGAASLTAKHSNHARRTTS